MAWDWDPTVTLRIIVMNVVLGIAVFSFVVIVVAAVVRQIVLRRRGPAEPEKEATIYVGRFGESEGEE